MSHTDVQLQYHHPSYVQADLSQVAIHLSPDGQRNPTFFQGKLTDPLLLREALSALYHVISSDYRYRPRDKTAYLLHLQRQAAQGGTKPSAANLKKAEEYMQQRLQQDDEDAEDSDIFDPLISVHPDLCFLEVFSKDESSYAKLSLKWDLFEDVKDLHYGTTHIDFSPDFYNALQNLRTYKNASLHIDPQGFSMPAEEDNPTAHLKDLHIPDSWLRGFLQVQSAATLPMTHFSLDPIDLYNVLIYLRQHKAKKSPRGLRFELIPGESPRIVLEPWEKVIFTKAPPYQGNHAQIIRTWGRKRLRLLARLLPLTTSIEVRTLGSGLPTFYVLHMPHMTFTLGLSGWTANDWSSSVQFDRMLPHHNPTKKLQKQLLSTLQNTWASSLEDLCEDLDADKQTVYAALQSACRQGLVIYDLDAGLYRYRQLSHEPLDTERLRFRNPREEIAHKLLAQEAATLTKINHVIGSGTEISGEVEDKEAYRTYQSSFFITLDGRLMRSKCTSPWFQRTKGKEGPSEYILALYLLYNQQRDQQEELRRSGQDRELIVAETRSLTRRKGSEETIVQLTLDHQHFLAQWGPRGSSLRSQKMLFNSPEEARQEYFQRIDSLIQKGFIETQA